MSSIRKIEISKLHEYKNIHWELNNNVNILVGINGIGKTTILRAVYNILSSEDKDIGELYDSIRIEFDNKSYIHKRIIKNPLEVFQTLSKQIERTIKKIEQHSTIKNENGQDLNSLIDKLRADLENKVINMSHSGRKIKKATEIERSNKKPTNYNIEYISNINLAFTATFLPPDMKGGVGKPLINSYYNEILDTFIQHGKDLSELTSTINFFFKECDKECYSKSNKIIFKNSICDTSLEYSELSSGEQQLVFMILKILNSKEKGKKTILLMDEPEISLHLSWQKSFIEKVKEIHPNSQIIITTHSPSMLINGWLSSMQRLEDIISNE